MTTIATFLMFSGEKHGKAEEAMSFYVAQFRNSRVDGIRRYGPGEKEPEGTVMFAKFTLNGQPFMAIDSAAPHQFNFTPSMSLFVDCESEEELDRLFGTLSEAGQVLMPLANYGFSRRFGWINDRFGVSWQLNLPTERVSKLPSKPFPRIAAKNAAPAEWRRWASSSRSPPLNVRR